MTSRSPVPDAFALHAVLDGCAAEVLLNGVPLADAALGRVEMSAHATPWIVDGVNELRLVVERTRRVEVLPVGAVAVDREAGPVFAWAHLIAGSYSDLVPDPKRDAVLAHVAWGPWAPHTRALPATTVQSFTVAGRPRWAWQDARVLDPQAPDDRAVVLAFVRDLHAAFVARDPAPVLARMTSLIAETVHFGPPGPAAFTAGFAAELASGTPSDDYQVAELREDDVVLRPIAGGRVLRVLSRAGGDLLRSAPGAAESWRFRLDVAMIQGRLELIRLA